MMRLTTARLRAGDLTLTLPQPRANYFNKSFAYKGVLLFVEYMKLSTWFRDLPKSVEKFEMN